VGCRLYRDQQHAVGEGKVQADQSVIEENQSIQNERWCVMKASQVKAIIVEVRAKQPEDKHPHA
jgi:hypothetical protein